MAAVPIARRVDIFGNLVPHTGSLLLWDLLSSHMPRTIFVYFVPCVKVHTVLYSMIAVIALGVHPFFAPSTPETNSNTPRFWMAKILGVVTPTSAGVLLHVVHII